MERARGRKKDKEREKELELKSKRTLKYIKKITLSSSLDWANTNIISVMVYVGLRMVFALEIWGGRWAGERRGTRAQDASGWQHNITLYYHTRSKELCVWILKAGAYAGPLKEEGRHVWKPQKLGNSMSKIVQSRPGERVIFSPFLWNERISVLKRIFIMCKRKTNSIFLSNANYML